MNASAATVQTRVHQLRQQKVFSRQARNLTATLAAMVQLDSQGHGLVMLLGDGHEANNLEALTTWVEGQIRHHDTYDRDALDVLFIRIQRIIGPVE